MAFLQEPERQPFVRVPAATIGLILVLAAAHVARVSGSELWSNEIIVNYAFIPARYSHAYLAAHGLDPGTIWDRAVPFVSYIFLHGNYTHLAINCVWLLPFGTIVARRFGTLSFLLFFLLCGVAAAAAHLMTNWGSPEATVGASGAISGLMGAGFRMIAAISDRETFAAAVSGEAKNPPPLAPLLSARLATWSIVWIAMNVIFGMTGFGAGIGSGPQLIAWQAHIGGYLAGLILAGPFDALGRLLRP